MANYEKRKRDGVNRVTLLGEVIGVPNKTVPLYLRLEVTEREKLGDNWADLTIVHNVMVDGKRAEALNKLSLEGSRLLVEGPMRAGKNSGFVHARSVILCGGKKREEGTSTSGTLPDEIPF